MTLSVLAAFWAVSFLFIITPGADWAYAISAGMRGRLVTPAVAGMLSGHLLATGHSLDDHTETVFLRLARGGGLGALH